MVIQVDGSVGGISIKWSSALAGTALIRADCGLISMIHLSISFIFDAPSLYDSTVHHLRLPTGPHTPLFVPALPVHHSNIKRDFKSLGPPPPTRQNHLSARMSPIPVSIKCDVFRLWGCLPNKGVPDGLPHQRFRRDAVRPGRVLTRVKLAFCRYY